MSHVTSSTLHLLLDELNLLSRTPFFSAGLQSYLGKLIGIVERIAEDYSAFQPEVAARIAYDIWIAAKYLRGGTSKAVPYETVYALRLALNDWTTHPCEITTALSEDVLDYHFLGIDPTEVIRQFVPDVEFESELIQIALPRLYRHRPLYNVALYHELGHYLDAHFGISDLSLILHPPASTDRRGMWVAHNHRMEHFADLFAASYTGLAFSKFLGNIAAGAAACDTHPATDARLQRIDRFLSGQQDAVVADLQNALSVLKLPPLRVSYKRPSLDAAFESIRTYRIADPQELHGILEAAWFLWERADLQENGPWARLPKKDIGRIINDLVEKSIRNYMTVIKWEHGNNRRSGA